MAAFSDDHARLVIAYLVQQLGGRVTIPYAAITAMDGMVLQRSYDPESDSATFTINRPGVQE